MIIFMWAESQNFVIGKDNKLPWHIKEEMNLFVKKTKNQNILMGRKTYDSIPSKPLNNKKSINVLTRTKKEPLHNETYFTNIEEAFKEIQGDIIIIGGLEIFKLAAPFVDKLYISHIHKDYEGDVFMPIYDVGSKQIKLFEQDFEKIKEKTFDDFTYFEYLKCNK